MIAPGSSRSATSSVRRPSVSSAASSVAMRWVRLVDWSLLVMIDHNTINRTYALPKCALSQRYFIFILYFVFALVGRKDEIQKKLPTHNLGKLRRAACRGCAFFVTAVCPSGPVPF